MNDDDDPDWEEESKQGEAEAKKREFWARVAACMRNIQKSHPLVIATLPPDTKLVVTTFEEDDDPLATGPVEFTIVDPASGKVRVKDRRNFTEPTEGILVGCEDNEAITPGTHYPCKSVLLLGELKRLCWLIYEAGGKRFDRGAIPNTIKRIEIYKPGMEAPLFVLWEDA